MRKFIPLVAAIITAITALSFGSASAQELPPPSAGTVLTSGLLQPKGIIIGPDGDLYVAESGTGGDSDFVVDGVTYKNGYTGRISRIDVQTGTRTTVADGLASNGTEDGEAVGPADVAFIGNTLYYLQTHAGDVWGFPDFETGIYRVQSNGDVELVADIGAFNAANPTESISSGAQADIEPGGNPYAFAVRNGVFYVSDGNHNRLLSVTTGGDIEEITEFPNHPVSTGLDFAPDGTAYVAYLGQGPFLAADGKVVRVNLDSGAIADVASGVPMLTDVQLGPGGQLYALSFNDTRLAGEEGFAPGTGSLLKVNGSTLTPVVVGLSFAAFVEFGGTTAYISNASVMPDGQIIKVENITSVTAPAQSTPTAVPSVAAQPTATPRGGGVIGAPDTGDGSSAGGDSSPLVLVLALAAGGLLVAGSAYGLRRR